MHTEWIVPNGRIKKSKKERGEDEKTTTSK
jgi:hypothetical protein